MQVAQQSRQQANSSLLPLHNHNTEEGDTASYLPSSTALWLRAERVH